MIESARSTDCTPPSLGSGSLAALDFGSMSLRRITFLFIATCNHPEGERRVPARIQNSAVLYIPRDKRRSGLSEAAAVFQVLQQPRAARPFVLGPQHLDRQFRRVGIGRDAVLIQI